MRIKKSEIFLLALILFVAFSTSASADYWENTRATEGHNRVTYSSSVSSYGYTSIYDNAIKQWNGISSKVSVKKASPSYYNDVYYVGNTSVADRTGFMQPMGARGNACLDCRWVYTRVYLYDNNMKAFNYSTTNRTATAIHEVGHSLKLAHTPDGAPSSIMRQGRKTLTGPTTYDKAQLKAKWGN